MNLIQEDLTRWQRLANHTGKGLKIGYHFMHAEDVITSDLKIFADLHNNLSGKKNIQNYDFIACFRRLEKFMCFLEARWFQLKMVLEQHKNPQFKKIFSITDYILKDVFTRINEKFETWDCTEMSQSKCIPLLALDNGVEYSFLNSPVNGLSFPVLFIPPCSQKNVWDLLVVFRELGRIIYTNINFDTELEEKVSKKIEQNEKFEETIIETIAGWVPEIFADIFSVLCVGPSFVSFLREKLLDVNICGIDYFSLYPPKYVRFMFNTESIRQVCNGKLNNYAGQLETEWEYFYGDLVRTTTEEDIVEYCPVIIHTILNSRLETLKKHSISELLQFSLSEQNIVNAVTEKYLHNEPLDIDVLSPRFILAGIRFAFEKWHEKKSLEKLEKKFFSSFNNIVSNTETNFPGTETTGEISSGQWKNFVMEGTTDDRITTILNLLPFQDELF